MPRTPGTPASMALRTAAIARATTSRSALISVGRKPVVPKRRWARPMARMDSTLGASLKSTPPAPVGRRDDVQNAPLAQQHAPVFRESVLEQHPAVGERHAHQRVSVTL